MDRKWPDIICSMDKKALKELIYWSKIIAKCRWWSKWPVKEEEPCINFAFATVVAIKNIKKWKILSKENIWVKRPGIWEIKAEEFENVLWKQANKNIEVDTHLSFKDII
jgi:N-acetylneuraminate synthase